LEDKFTEDELRRIVTDNDVLTPKDDSLTLGVRLT